MKKLFWKKNFLMKLRKKYGYDFEVLKADIYFIIYLFLIISILRFFYWIIFKYMIFCICYYGLYVLWIYIFILKIIIFILFFTLAILGYFLIKWYIIERK